MGHFQHHLDSGAARTLGDGRALNAVAPAQCDDFFAFEITTLSSVVKLAFLHRHPSHCITVWARCEDKRMAPLDASPVASRQFERGRDLAHRLIAPGWYGIASVKWLKRIEVRDTRFMGRFMTRDYVTIREGQRKGETVWMETSVGRALLMSVPAKVTRKNNQYRIIGAAWRAPIAGWRAIDPQGNLQPWMIPASSRNTPSGRAMGSGRNGFTSPNTM